jgi:hypothetical protein
LADKNETLLSWGERLFRESISLANSIFAFFRLGRGRENDFSRRLLALKIHFLPSDKLKLQIRRYHKSVNLRFLLSLQYHFLPLVKKNNEMCAVGEAMFQGVRLLCKLIFCLSTQPKMRFGGGQESDV